VGLAGAKVEAPVAQRGHGAKTLLDAVEREQGWRSWR
jgi:hypothetical protein